MGFYGYSRGVIFVGCYNFKSPNASAKRIGASHIGNKTMDKDKDKPNHLRLVTRDNTLTSKQEHFAQMVSRGETLTDAYRSAYDAENMKASSIWVEACKLNQNPNVAQRVEALTADIAARKQSEEERMRMFVVEQLKQEALNAQSDGARVQALTALGRSCALFEDRQVIEDNRDTRQASEIRADLERRLARLMGE